VEAVFIRQQLVFNSKQAYFLVTVMHFKEPSLVMFKYHTSEDNLLQKD
jgi:hypothetical protein